MEEGEKNLFFFFCLFFSRLVHPSVGSDSLVETVLNEWPALAEMTTSRVISYANVHFEGQ